MQVASIIIVMVNISTLALHSNQPIMADLSVLGTGIIETELLVASDHSLPMSVTDSLTD